MTHRITNKYVLSKGTSVTTQLIKVGDVRCIERRSSVGEDETQSVLVLPERQILVNKPSKYATQNFNNLSGVSFRS